MSAGARQHVLIAIPVLFVGGTELQTLALARVLGGAGYSVTVCCYYDYDGDMVQRFTAAGAAVHLMKCERTKGLWHLAKELRKLLIKIQPDIVHVQYIAPGLVPIIAARFAGVRTVFATVHQPGSIYGWKEKLLIRSASWFSTAFFCNSTSVEESWFGSSKVFNPQESTKRRKHFTIYNGIDVDHIHEIIKSSDRSRLRDSLGIRNNPVIGVVGRLRWEKGQSVLLDALAEVTKTVQAAMLLVIGDGPDRMSLELRAKSLRLAGNILWLGQKSPEEVYELYSIMDVAAVPSLLEGFGLAAAEAMAAGLPVVATRVDGLTEVIADNVAGFLVPASDSHALSKTIIRILADPEEAELRGLNGKKRVKEFFSMDLFSQNIISAYNYFSYN